MLAPPRLLATFASVLLLALAGCGGSSSSSSKTTGKPAGTPLTQRDQGQLAAVKKWTQAWNTDAKDWYAAYRKGDFGKKTGRVVKRIAADQKSMEKAAKTVTDPGLSKVVDAVVAAYRSRLGAMRAINDGVARGRPENVKAGNKQLKAAAKALVRAGQQLVDVVSSRGVSATE